MAGAAAEAKGRKIGDNSDVGGDLATFVILAFFHAFNHSITGYNTVRLLFFYKKMTRMRGSPVESLPFAG